MVPGAWALGPGGFETKEMLVVSFMFVTAQKATFKGTDFSLLANTFYSVEGSGWNRFGHRIQYAVKARLFAVSPLFALVYLRVVAM